MLDKLFIEILNMSFIASFVIIFVIIARLLLKKSPKIFSYILWSVVLFRLLCPFSFETSLAIFEKTQPIPQNIVYEKTPEIDTGIDIVDNSVNEVLPPVIYEESSINPIQIWIFASRCIWLLGIFALSLYSIISLIKVKRKLDFAVHLKDNVYLCDYITSPFVFGLITPKIYLPSNILENEQDYIIAHEQTHINRFDYITRIIAFIALALHWFNPLVWVAFILSGKDMELSCDESVMAKTRDDIRSEYSSSLLKFATGNRISPSPLAFGEVNTKERITNVMKYKKPVLWVSITALALIIVVSVCLISNKTASKNNSITFMVDEINGHDKFAMSGNFPLDWSFKDSKGDEDIPTGDFYEPVYIYNDDQLLGYIGFNTFTPYDGEIPDEQYYQSVWSSLRLSPFAIWEPFTSIYRDDNFEVGTVDIDYIPESELEANMGAMPNAEHIKTNGILAYDKSLEVYIGIGFIQDVISNDELTTIAKSIEITPVTKLGLKYNNISDISHLSNLTNLI